MASPDESPSFLNKELLHRYEQLSESLPSYDENDIVEIERVGRTLADIDHIEKYQLSQRDANALLSFYISAVAKIEAECTLVISAKVFDFGQTREGAYQFIQEGFTQSTREDMIYYLGLMDSGLKGELARVRRRRNELAHSQRHRLVDDPDRILSDIKRALKAVEKIIRIENQVERQETVDLADFGSEKIE